MKRLIILSAVILLPLLSVSQTSRKVVTYYDAFKKYPQEVYTEDSKTGEKQGKYVAYFSDNTIQRECNYVNGELHGSDTWFYNTGYRRGLAHVDNYKKGLKDGEQKNYEDAYNGGYAKHPTVVDIYKDGNRLSQKIYGVDGGKPYVATEEQFDLDGNTVTLKRYDSDGVQWYQQAENGRNFSLARFGNNHYEFTAVDGKREGEYKEYYRDSPLLAHIIYKNGSRYWMKSYYENGSLQGEIDSVSGKYTSLYSNGKVKYSLYPVNDNLHGEVRTFYESGELFQILSYDSGKLDGTCKEFYKNGTVKRDHLYKANVRVSGNEYDSNGIKTDDYLLDDIKFID